MSVDSAAVGGDSQVSHDDATDVVETFDVIVEREKCRNYLSGELSKLRIKMWKQIHGAVTEIKRSTVRDTTETVILNKLCTRPFLFFL